MKYFKIKTKKNPRKKITYIILSVSLVLLIVVGGVFVAVNNLLNKIEYDDLTIPPDAYTSPDVDDIDSETTGDYPSLSDEELAALGLVPDSELKSDENVINILLLGVDAQDGNIERARSDSMIVLSINKTEEKFSMISVMRDLVVVIPGRKTVNKINAAHVYGGPGLAIKTVEGNLGIKIDSFIRVDFFAFMEIVDILGGVDIEVSNAEMQLMNSKYITALNQALHLPYSDGYLTSSGLQQLTGKQALAYARIRYIGNGDFDRTGRQRAILDQVFTKMKESSASQLLNLINVLAPYVRTNMSRTQLISMVMLFLKAKSWPMNQGRIPLDGSWKPVSVRGMDCLSFDAEVNRAYLLEELYGSSAHPDDSDPEGNNSNTPDNTGGTDKNNNKLLLYIAVPVVVIGGTAAGLLIHGSAKKKSARRRR